MSKTTKDPGDYEVGRGKPPKHSRFQPGHSGNPGGKKKGTPCLKTVLDRIASSEIEVQENGRKRWVSLAEALLLRQAQDGLRGDGRATERFLDRMERLLGQAPEVGEELPEDDLLVIARAIRTGPDQPPGASSADEEESD